MNLREFREMKKLGLNEVARMTGLQASTLSRIETGKRNLMNLSLKYIAALKRVYRLDNSRDLIELWKGTYEP